MELRNVMAKRRSVRKYKPDPVPDAKLNRLYEALRAAPSGGNRQDYAFIFVRDAEKRRRIVKEACHQEFIGQAPVLMVACCGEGGGFDVAIAVDHMILAATDEGLGTCWIGWFEREPVRTILGIPESKEVPIMVAIGYAAEAPEARARKPLEDLIMADAYRGPAETV